VLQEANVIKSTRANRYDLCFMPTDALLHIIQQDVAISRRFAVAGPVVIFPEIISEKGVGRGS
jgi:hypothetical protein